METTDWDAYGTGNYEKCADCMVHSGYEATAVVDSVKHPLKVGGGCCAGRSRGRDGAGISLENQRPAEYVFSRHVQDAMRKAEHKKPDELADAAD